MVEREPILATGPTGELQQCKLSIIGDLRTSRGPRVLANAAYMQGVMHDVGDESSGVIFCRAYHKAACSSVHVLRSGSMGRMGRSADG